VEGSVAAVLCLFVGVIPQRLAIKVLVDLVVVKTGVVRGKSQLLAVEDSTVAHHVPAHLNTVTGCDKSRETAESYEACCLHVHAEYLDVIFFCQYLWAAGKNRRK